MRVRPGPLRRSALRIALVSEHASPLAVLGGVDAGGQNVHVAALARALAERGHEVSVYTRRDDPALPARIRLADRLEVVHVDAGPPEPLPKDALLPHMSAFAQVLVREWTRSGARPRAGGSRAGGSRSGEHLPDLVHAHFWMSALATRTAARATGIPFGVTFHALGSVKHRHQGAADTSPMGRIAMEAALAADADAVLATCRDEVGELTALGVPVERLHIVPCGVDTTAFTPDGPGRPGGDRSDRGRPDRGRPDRGWPDRGWPDRGRSGRARSGDTPSAARLRLLCVGRLVERKGVDDAIRALAVLVRGPHPVDAELLVAGGPVAGELGADLEARRLTTLARELGVADRVHLLGRIGRRDLPEQLRAADVVVAPPEYEPFGIVPLEAMACGRPVVGSAVGGLLDTVVDGETGLLVPPRDPARLAAAIATLAGDPALRDRFGRAGRQRSLGYDWSRIAARTEEVYRQVLRASRVAVPSSASPVSASPVSAGPTAASPVAASSVAAPVTGGPVPVVDALRS